MNKEQTETPENADGESPENITEDRQESNEVVDDNDSGMNDNGVDENVENVEKVDVAALESQLNDAKDQYLRAKAEMENIRRRADKQVSDSRKFAVENFAKELLGVRDSLQLAAEVEIEAEDSDAVKSMKEGLSLTLKQLDGVFGKFSIQEIAPEAGEKLDPNLHQAITMVPSAEVEAGCIISTMQKGYQLNERLLRPAMVVVAKAAES